MDDNPQSKPENPGNGQAASYLLISFISAVVGALVGGVMIFGFVMSYFGVSPSDVLFNTGKQPVTADSSKTGAVKNIVVTSEEVAVAVAEKASPSVVNIRVEKTVIQYGFFGPHYGKTGGTGSGVIIDRAGHILTNNHVVQDAEEIYITLADGKDVPGKVLGRDPETDIAIVKIEAPNLVAAETGTSHELEVGETVIAIGNPFGLEKTVTQGVISALHRSINTTTESGEEITYFDLIQTDAAINPGNSGGALCDKEGRLIGINTLIYSQSGGSEGIGFAIPIDAVMNIADQLIKTGKASHPFIGIYGGTLTQKIAEDNDLSVDSGAIIAQIIEGSPAEKAGLKQGDIIIRIDDSEIGSMDDLMAVVRQKKVGDTISIIMVRDNKEQVVKATLAEKSAVVK